MTDDLDKLLQDYANLKNQLEFQRVINAAAGAELVKMYQSAALAYATVLDKFKNSSN